jgi:hypothetical protein
MGKPVGYSPIEIDGIMLRKSAELPEGIQALYDEKSGNVLWVGYIGQNPRGLRATAITLSPRDYEIALKTHRERGAKATARRWRH